MTTDNGVVDVVIPNDELSKNQHYEDALDDVHTRFILNLPDTELNTSDRLFFQLEQAWWYYEDWICDVHPEYHLPRYTIFKLFAKMMFEYSPILSTLYPLPTQFYSMWNEFSMYKRTISNYGCILVTSDCQHMVLCTLYNSKTVTFPAGKINHGEDGITAAARETYEETGFDPLCKRGLTNLWKEQQQQSNDCISSEHNNITWSTNITEQDMLVHQEESINDGTTTNGGAMKYGKRRTCYVVVGVPKDFPFAPVCRKEVSNISWFPVNGIIPKPSFGVVPFLPQLKRYISKYMKSQQHQHRQDQTPLKQPNNNSATTRSEKSTKKRNTSDPNNASSRSNKSTPNQSRNNSWGRNQSNVKGKKSSSRGRTINVIEDDDNDLVRAGLASFGEPNGWSEQDMFKATEKLLLTVRGSSSSNNHQESEIPKYDGNPHVFAEQGFAVDEHGVKIDPHSYRIVGGTLLNQKETQNYLENDKNKYGGGGTSSNRSFPLEDNKELPVGSRLQPLFNSTISSNNNNNNNDDIDLKPFFSDDGATPWGEIVQGISHTNVSHISSQLSATTATTTKFEHGKVNLSSKKGDSRPNSKRKPRKENDSTVPPPPLSGSLDVFSLLTDAEITKKSQEEKMKNLVPQLNMSKFQISGNEEGNAIMGLGSSSMILLSTPTTTNEKNKNTTRSTETLLQRKHRQIREQKYTEDMVYINQWVSNLPKPVATKYFGVFKLDADLILNMVAEKNEEHHTIKKE